MKKTVLITGASSGIGRAAVIEFAKQGWQVAATMRNPEKENELHKLENVQLFTLDVANETSVKSAFDKIIRQFGKLDAVVNNAGYGVDGVFEAMTDEIIEKQYNTNVFGLMRVTREALKYMREQQEGNIVQVSSMGGRIAFPLFSIYHGTKWAVEGFTESLQYEVEQFNIHLKLIEPGAINTEFYGRSRTFVQPDYTQAYDAFVKNADKIREDAGNKGDSAEKVAKAIVKAASDKSGKLRYPVGNPAPAILLLRRIIPFSWWKAIVKMTYKMK
jgi:NAD(P)-dependent dehydrogenase (short-subunit alcohol dehydrogenase family)